MSRHRNHLADHSAVVGAAGNQSRCLEPAKLGAHPEQEVVTITLRCAPEGVAASALHYEVFTTTQLEEFSGHTPDSCSQLRLLIRSIQFLLSPA